MLNYILRRLFLLPITLFFIILINFFIINLAPGEPTTVTEISSKGDASKNENQFLASPADGQYLQFREYFGLTLPVLFNSWPSVSKDSVEMSLKTLANRNKPSSQKEMNVKNYNELRILFGDQSRYTMSHLLKIAEDTNIELNIRLLAIQFYVRGGTRQGFIGPKLSKEQKKANRSIAENNQILQSFLSLDKEKDEHWKTKLSLIRQWHKKNTISYNFTPTSSEKIRIFFFETRFFRYLSRVLTLDFGSLRNDPNKTVLSEVSKRFKYSLTLAFLPMLITFVLCQVFGFYMALKQNQWQDLSLNIIFLILYAIPIFVTAPFLIEKVALYNTFPFTDISIPLSGFTSKEEIYKNLTSWQRIWDVLQHIALPLLAIIYGSLAAQTRLSRTAVLETLRQDYVKTAYAKGLHPIIILFKHVGRNASITIVTSIAGSLGIILGGSLIIETIFEINGFGRFFYEAILNRDYNVIMFSSLSSSFFTLTGYLLADIAYTLLDPRITLE